MTQCSNDPVHQGQRPRLPRDNEEVTTENTEVVPPPATIKDDTHLDQTERGEIARLVLGGARDKESIGGDLRVGSMPVLANGRGRE